MTRLANSWNLAKASWAVLKHDKELVVLPIISAIASLIVGATFVIPLLASEGWGFDEQPGLGTYIVIFVMYVALAYVTIFFNAALVSAAHERLTGGDPTIRSAIGGAASRAGKILPWAIVSATVSLILRAIEERAGAIGQIAAGIAGLAWTVVTFLVLPVIVIEGMSVGDAVKKSGNLFKRTWGENLAAQVGFGLIGFIAVLPAIAIVFLGAGAGGGVLATAILIAVAWVIGVAVVLAALSGIFQTTLYHFATDGHIPTEFDGAALRAAFAPRQGRRGIAGFGG